MNFLKMANISKTDRFQKGKLSPCFQACGVDITHDNVFSFLPSYYLCHVALFQACGVDITHDNVFSSLPSCYISYGAATLSSASYF